MYCPKCGDKNPDDARFCGNCGAPLPAAGAERAPQQDAPPPSSPANRPSPRQPDSGNQDVPAPELRIGIAIASVVVPVVGIVMGIIYLNSSSAAKKSAGKLWLAIGGVMTIVYCFLASFIGY